jgi:dihydrolipoamide dehydrogenase
MADRAERDLVVLGAGPGGYAAAFLAADRGLQVTIIDEMEKPGGTCLHVGCIPSKTLLHVAKVITETKEAESWGISFGKVSIDLDTLRRRSRNVVDTLAKNLAELCKRRKVEYIRASAAFETSNSLRLNNGTTIRFRNCIIAVGSSPARPGSMQLETSRVMDSTAALRVENIPKSLLVVGGGYIGLELGCVYAALGSEITVVELTDGLLPGVDRDLVRPLQARLELQFKKIHLNTKVTKLTEQKSGIQVGLEGGEIEDRTPTFENVLVAVGRRPNTRGLGLEKTGVDLDEKGFIKVDLQRRTSVENIYAIGDVAGEPMLAHKASHEGKIAVEAVLGEPAAFDFLAVPAVVFTDPEIAWCGLMENDARRQEREVKVLRFPWGASGRAATLGRGEGLTKLITEPDTERVLGVGLVGYGAGELIGEGVLAVEMAATARDLSLIIHPHPTLSETIGEAAESLYGPTTHIFKQRRDKNS